MSAWSKSDAAAPGLNPDVLVATRSGGGTGTLLALWCVARLKARSSAVTFSVWSLGRGCRFYFPFFLLRFLLLGWGRLADSLHGYAGWVGRSLTAAVWTPHAHSVAPQRLLGVGLRVGVHGVLMT